MTKNFDLNSGKKFQVLKAPIYTTVPPHSTPDFSFRALGNRVFWKTAWQNYAIENQAWYYLASSRLCGASKRYHYNFGI